MPIWRVAPVNEDPEIVLVRWRIYEVEDGNRHFVGYNEDGHEGRVSSRIVEFDKETMTGRTNSGRTYKLVGPSHYDGDADYVWQLWSYRNKVGESKDVSKKL